MADKVIAGPIELGDEVKDTVTSFSGVVIAITEWLNGCRRMVVQPRQLGEKGQMPSTESIDENQLVITKKGAVVAQNTPRRESAEVPARKTGGPRPDAKSWPSATR